MFFTFSGLFLSLFSLFAQGFEGYYQYPDVHDDLIVFCAEGDIWTVPLTGGLARRLTTHPEEEFQPVFSPDGQTVLFSASYEGPVELYTIPVEGGLTKRWSYEADPSIANAWSPSGEIVYATRAYNKKPDFRLVKINPQTKVKSFVPLDQASEGSYDDSGNTLYFVRPAFHRQVTKRYKGGTARQVWKYDTGDKEAVKLTKIYKGESHHPRWYQGRVYFITDRDGTMNIWSMDENGDDLVQHTRHSGFDVRYANVSNGVIVYQLGADIMKYDLASKNSEKIEITLATDLDQLRVKWEENPFRHITSVHPDKTGEKIVITARGRIFSIPTKSGRAVSFTEKSGVRYRDAVFSPDGKNIISLSDESGEFEFVSLPVTSAGPGRQLTRDGKILRFQGVPSFDGKWLAYNDLDRKAYVVSMDKGVGLSIPSNLLNIGHFSWSPDSKWLAFVQQAKNQMAQIWLYNVESREHFELTTDRANSLYPQWSPDGKFLYFLSDRNFKTLVGSPWGPRQPEPYFDQSEKIYLVALQKGTRSPFRPADELEAKAEKTVVDEKKKKKGKGESSEKLIVKIDREGLQQRIEEVPVKPGNYSQMAINNKAIYVLSSETGENNKSHLACIKIDNEKPEIKVVLKDIKGFELTADGKKLMVQKGNSIFMSNAGTTEITKLEDDRIDLSGWKFQINPREDWKQIFTDAWRMERDYFYDKNMHGVNWKAMYDKYLPLLERITTRSELSDLIGRYVGELSALHTSVRGGDLRTDERNIDVSSLGGIFSRDETGGGYRIDYIYQADPDYPNEKSPLADPYLDIQKGDVITHVNGRSALVAIDIGELIRNEASKQVRVTLKRGGAVRDVIVKPIGNEFNLRYRDWEYGNRLYVEEKSNSDIGYLHLRAMSSNDINQFYREFYPVFNRKGLVIDVRYNYGGNIDSFILEKLLRKAWMYWAQRSGDTPWNMQYAFRGHIVVLVNENTYSDGEAFADGFRRLGLGTTVGVRTWGGEIWLSSANRLSDGGLARAPMMGVYANGEWLIEGHGFVPDIEIDNLPHATFNNQDAQLDTAIDLLQKLIKDDPRELPKPPPYPDKSFDNK